MSKVSVLREVTDLAGTELLDLYDKPPDDQVRDDLRAELLRRLDPPKTKPRPAVPAALALSVSGKGVT